MAQPWLPPLKERITLGELDKVVPIELGKNGQLKRPDRGRRYPASAKQEAVAIDLSKDGNILLYGSPGTGKTTFLQTATMDLARKQSPENLTIKSCWISGTNGLAPLTQLPHVADSLLLDQTEKIQKFIRIINRELDRRKKLLSEHGVGTIALYREVTGKQEPTMVIPHG